MPIVVPERWSRQPSSVYLQPRSSLWMPDSIIFAPAILKDLGTRQSSFAINGSDIIRGGRDGVELYHPSTTGADSLTFDATTGATNGFSGVIRFQFTVGSQTSLFNSANDNTTQSAVHIRTSGSSPNYLQFASRDTAVRITASGPVLKVGKWYTVAFRAGVYPKQTTGTPSAVMFIDGNYVGRYDSPLTTAWTISQFAVGGGRYSSDTAQAQAHSISLAAFAFQSVPDAELQRVSADPWGVIFGTMSPIIYSFPSGAIVPTLSSATVTDIATYTARPRVTVTF